MVVLSGGGSGAAMDMGESSRWVKVLTLGQKDLLYPSAVKTCGHGRAMSGTAVPGHFQKPFLIFVFLKTV